ncbi:MarR family winged helix-turn-helix transcriptional regulator [Sphingomonas sp. UNC305MFCol5.2]|uniref:MarR family winged helix-turn-helix transcriptional regulator n=1 Tax=Sphingomonas sp. UNC305MFCol5.2 TaxID=1449076 RepID=UPI000472358B|nr:MarR family transcriptional regulator [Sphingomonas sp. UNC305MFCol5.2]
MSRHIDEAADRIDARMAQWACELPDVDTTGMAILGRMRWITLSARPVIERIFEEENLDTGEFDVLATLLRSGAPYRLRPTELHRSLMISSGGLTDRLRRLTQAGLVSRPVAQEDGRSLLVELTREGRAKAERVFRKDMEVEMRMLSMLDAEERNRLANLLRKLSHSIAISAF